MIPTECDWESGCWNNSWSGDYGSEWYDPWGWCECPDNEEQVCYDDGGYWTSWYFDNWSLEWVDAGSNWCQYTADCGDWEDGCWTEFAKYDEDWNTTYYDAYGWCECDDSWETGGTNDTDIDMTVHVDEISYDGGESFEDLDTWLYIDEFIDHEDNGDDDWDWEQECWDDGAYVESWYWEYESQTWSESDSSWCQYTVECDWESGCWAVFWGGDYGSEWYDAYGWCECENNETGGSDNGYWMSEDEKNDCWNAGGWVENYYWDYTN